MYQRTETREEQLQAEYVTTYGEKMEETIIESWLDGSQLWNNAEFKSGLRALLASQDALEIAQLAASLVGNPGFEEYVELRS